MTYIHPAMLVPAEQVSTLCDRVEAFKNRPERWSFELRAIIVALDAIQPCDEFQALIDQLNDELGLTSVEALGDDREHDENWTWALYDSPRCAGGLAR